ncbi:MAG TPA: small ribosomal subunit biogenesis GTPase RsgA [Gammaproteobacteria bacterium]|nr:small ribosomal subunit biogenesis GTPase RsgA [Gammaproteobacteria bacterium]
MKNKKQFHHKSLKLDGQERKGLLVTAFGLHAEVEDEQGNLVRCHIRKNSDPVITGDQVYWLPEKEAGTGVIIGHLPRKSLLCRPENAHKLKLIAANLDAIIIVTAPPPVLSEDMIDRYLVASEILKIQPVILLNKMDLLDPEHTKEMTERLGIYQKMGYRVIYSSTYTRDGLSELDEFLREKTCVLVGASGVGKSSIIAALTLEPVRVGEVSAKGLGKHTTTNTHLYHLPHNSNLIDSPGVREFGLWHIDKNELLAGFIEFKSFFNECKFRNCQHEMEPGCAVQEALRNKKIDERRYASYLKILAGLGQKKKGKSK